MTNKYNDYGERELIEELIKKDKKIKNIKDKLQTLIRDWNFADSQKNQIDLIAILKNF